MKQQTTVNYCTVLGELKTNGGHRCSVSTELIQEGSTLDTAAAKSRQLCPTLCDPIDGSPPGPPVPGILKPRTLEWAAIAFSTPYVGTYLIYFAGKKHRYSKPGTFHLPHSDETWTFY